MTNQPKIAVIGAGLAGVSLAKNLADFADITLFEKSRGSGGTYVVSGEPDRFSFRSWCSVFLLPDQSLFDQQFMMH